MNILIDCVHFAGVHWNLDKMIAGSVNDNKVVVITSYDAECVCVVYFIASWCYHSRVATEVINVAYVWGVCGHPTILRQVVKGCCIIVNHWCGNDWKGLVLEVQRPESLSLL